MTRKNRSRGAVLIVVLGVLVVLALLGTTFATLQGVERRVSRNYLDEVRATLLAQSGIDHALAELQKLAGIDLIPSSPVQPWRYWGDDVDETGPGAGSLIVPIEEAKNPSFAEENETPQDPYNAVVAPRLIKIRGRDRGFSSAMSSGQYARHGDLYVLKVTDSSGKIFLNEGISHSLGNNSSASQNLRRILNQLGAVGSVNIPGLGNLVLNNRPIGGYASVRELRKFLTDVQYRSASDFLTAHAWTDDQVANPVPLTSTHATDVETELRPLTDNQGIQYWRGAPALYRFGRGKDHLGRRFPDVPALAPFLSLQVFSSTRSNAFPGTALNHAIYALDELNPQHIEITSRAPVNVNSASKEVLTALLSDLRGVFVSERRRNNVETRRVGGYFYCLIKHTYSPENMPIPMPGLSLPYSTYYSNPAIYNVPEGDEYGFLYETWPIVGPAGTGSGISAVEVAEHFVACREARSTQGAATVFDYGAATVPFRGPFHNWRQFNAFCDHLVTIGVLEDPRGKPGGLPAVFFDHQPGPANSDWGGNITGNWPFLPSEPQRLAASQAIADVLKANFNPNLHLNELNPDKNLHLMVDKTDLAVNSTEFLFTPTGYYDIESVGRVLHPTDNTDDSLTAADNDLMAETKIHAGVKLFDLIRHTSQSRFRAGTISALGASSFATNNGRSLEIGPEPDNGSAPSETHWDGTLAWPTLGGNLPVGSTKASDSLVSTPDAITAGGEGLDAKIHTHLSWDFNAHYHADGDDKRRDMGSHTLDPVSDKLRNFPDPDEEALPTGLRATDILPPYDPTDNGGSFYRLARSFTLKPGFSMPNLDRRAGLDLRVDGGYVERHSGLAYWISTNSYVLDTSQKKGAMAYWIKPSFTPERSGKPRMYMDMSRRGRAPNNIPVPWNGANFIHFWNAGHDNNWGSNTAWGVAFSMENASTWTESTRFIPSTNIWGPVPFKPQSMIFGVGYGNYVGYSDWNGTSGIAANYYQYMETPALNHEGHGHGAAPGFNNLFRDHRWIHVSFSWQKVPDSYANDANGINTNYSMNTPTNPVPTYRVYVNGQLLPGYLEVISRYFLAGGERDYLMDFTTHYNGTTHHFGNPNGGERNALRFGSPSVVYRGSLASTAYPPFNQGDDFDNFTADSTMDEIYFWNNHVPYATAATSLWNQGRYSFPKSAGEGVYVSPEIPIAPPGERNLAPVSGVAPPVVSGGGAGAGSGSTMSMASSGTKVLGITWTWYAEGYEPGAGGMVPTLQDRGPAGLPLHPTIEASLANALGAPITAQVSDDGYSPLGVSLGSPAVRYRLKFGLPDADPLNSILLTTPVVDDVTLYVSTGGTTFTYYFCDATAL